MEITKHQLAEILFKNKYKFSKRIFSYDFEFNEIIQQSCFVILNTQRNTYNFDNENKMFSFLTTVVNNVCIDTWRYIQHYHFIPVEYVNNKEVNIYDDLPETVLQFALDFDELTEEQKRSIELYYYYGLKYEEIAKRMECSIGNVKSRLFYAKRKLKKSSELNKIMEE